LFKFDLWLALSKSFLKLISPSSFFRLLNFWAGSDKLGFKVLNSSWVVLDSLALVEEVTEVLHGVGVGLSAGFGVQIDHVAVALEVLVGGW